MPSPAGEGTTAGFLNTSEVSVWGSCVVVYDENIICINLISYFDKFYMPADGDLLIREVACNLLEPLAVLYLLHRKRLTPNFATLLCCFVHKFMVRY